VRVKSYTEALRLANAAGMDAANRRMRKAGRTAWSVADRNHCCEVVETVLVSLGYDVRHWNAMAGVPRNEPDEPPPAKGKSKGKRRPRQSLPVQLAFSFA
jgi:hypothetical protein